MSVSAVLFDLDGTLLDTLEDLYLTVNQVFKANGYPERTKDEVRLNTGHGALYLLRSLLPDTVSESRAKAVLEEYKPLLKENSKNHTKPYEGISGLIAELNKRGITPAVLSNKPDETVSTLTELYFKDQIAANMGDKAGMPRKPDPAGALSVLEEINKTADQAVYVGDSETDVETARNLGVPSIGVTWGFRDREALEKAGADYIIDTPAELLEIIDKLNGRQ